MSDIGYDPEYDERDWEASDDAWRGSRREYRSAHARAEYRAELAEDLIKYLAVCVLLLVFLRPIGIIVAILWGLRLLRRYSRLRLYPNLRRRWVREEVRRRHSEVRRRSLYRDPAYRDAMREIDAV